MTNKTLKTVIIGGSLLILAISLTQNAIIRDYHGAEPESALAYFLGGIMAVLGGGVLEWLVWLANPLCLLSIIFLVTNNSNAKVTAPIALILALWYRCWHEQLGSESGAMSKIVSFETGYYLWVLSIFVLNAGIAYYFYRIPNNTGQYREV